MLKVLEKLVFKFEKMKNDFVHLYSPPPPSSPGIHLFSIIAYSPSHFLKWPLNFPASSRTIFSPFLFYSLSASTKTNSSQTTTHTDDNNLSLLDLFILISTVHFFVFAFPCCSCPSICLFILLISTTHHCIHFCIISWRGKNSAKKWQTKTKPVAVVIIIGRRRRRNEEKSRESSQIKCVRGKLNLKFKNYLPYFCFTVGITQSHRATSERLETA